MTAFDRLHASLQHHIVNSLGWRELRALQEQAIAPVLDGRHCLLLAPTAGGKTEAAVFPLLSRMLAEDWRGLSVLYVCPIRALLNNICERALKRAVLHRKNALFYRTLHGAEVGDLFMTLIHTCQLCGANSFDYLTQLQRHARELTAQPAEWMPWNYRQTLEPPGV